MAPEIDAAKARRAEKQREYQRRYRAGVGKARAAEYTKANREKINARVRADNEKDPQKFRARSRKKYLANAESEKNRARAYRARNPEKAKVYSRRSTLKRRYGLTEAAFGAMLLSQDNCCAICRLSFDDRRVAAVDHDHATGKVRALLCRKCNSGIALLGENPEILSRAIEYLAEHGDA